MASKKGTCGACENTRIDETGHVCRECLADHAPVAIYLPLYERIDEMQTWDAMTDLLGSHAPRWYVPCDAGVLVFDKLPTAAIFDLFAISCDTIPEMNYEGPVPLVNLYRRCGQTWNGMSKVRTAKTAEILANQLTNLKTAGAASKEAPMTKKSETKSLDCYDCDGEGHTTVDGDTVACQTCQGSGKVAGKLDRKATAKAKASAKASAKVAKVAKPTAEPAKPTAKVAKVAKPTAKASAKPAEPTAKVAEPVPAKPVKTIKKVAKSGKGGSYEAILAISEADRTPAQTAIVARGLDNLKAAAAKAWATRRANAKAEEKATKKAAKAA